MNASVENFVDANSPWLGLASFTEDTRAFFFGRDEEISDLARRVQKKLLTVLFGQSGLGKTSILRAGLVPKLRAQGFCPVYVRIDYAADAPEPADQIKQAIARTARVSGQWTQTGVAAKGESLWEFLHHRDDVLRDGAGRVLIPLIIFDQFEELFTLAQTDETGRARAAQFIVDLSDLVENRPPREFEIKLETDETATERFDFARSDYRVLIALREDYLAPLESLKTAMPSIAQNRLRLAPMTGRQALAAVMEPGKGLVNEEVAAAIVRFVAGGAELQNAEVEPALLSLVCRELNDARIAAGRRDISPDLLKGSQDSILSNFYERSLADQPGSVRRIIEDQLLTASGFRENIAEEQLLAAFKKAAAPPASVGVLVDRRLLRVEERLDRRRVELTHDVLCGVVKASRDLRQEREVRERSERLLAEQNENAHAARRALLRARRVAIGCITLALAAIFAAVMAVRSTQRAGRAESETQQARVQAEALLGYLSNDFATQLETYGQLETIASISQRQIEYYRGLPASLKSVQSSRTGAVAMIQYAKAETGLGNTKAAGEAASEAVKLLEQLRQQGDNSEGTGIALGSAYAALASKMSTTAEPAALGTAKKARDILKPIATAPDATPAARRAYVGALLRLGAEQQPNSQERQSGADNLQEARTIAASLPGGLDAPDAAALYVAAAAWEVDIRRALGEYDEARMIGREGDRLARSILEKRPDYLSVLHDAQIMYSYLAALESETMNPTSALEMETKAWDFAQNILRRDPNNSANLNNASWAVELLGWTSFSLGNIVHAVQYLGKSDDLDDRTRANGAWFNLRRLVLGGWRSQNLADWHADAEANRSYAAVDDAFSRLEQSEPPGSTVLMFAEAGKSLADSSFNMGRGKFLEARSQASRAMHLVENLVPAGSWQQQIKDACMFDGQLTQGEAELWLGEYADAAVTLKKAISLKPEAANLTDKRNLSYASVMEGIALARLNHLQEARSLIEPELQFQRELNARNHGDQMEFLYLAQTLYADSLVDPKNRASLRTESQQLMGKMSKELQATQSVTRWRETIARER